MLWQDILHSRTYHRVQVLPPQVVGNLCAIPGDQYESTCAMNGENDWTKELLIHSDVQCLQRKWRANLSDWPPKIWEGHYDT